MTEPLIFLPGMMCDARLFLPQIASLSGHISITVMPLQGHRTMADLAKRVLAKAPPYFALAGLSMGGIVAMEIVRQAPQRVTRLALLDTNPLADSADKAPLRQAQVKRVLQGELHAVMRDELKPNYLASGPDQQHILTLCMQMAETLGHKVFEDQSYAIQHRPDQCETLRAVTVPSLVLCGKEDRLCPVSRHELMHELIPGSRLAVIANAGHLPTLEQPDLTNRILKEWLRL